MRILVASSGSYGDILPFIAIGREMKRRGHEVVFFASPYFEPAVRQAELPLVGIGSVEDYQSAIHDHDVTDPRKGFKVVARVLSEHLPEAYREMDAALRPGETLLVGSTLAFQTRLLREKRGVPAVTLHLAPSMFRSAYQAPKMADPGIPEWFPPALKRLVWRLVDRFIADPVFGRGLNRFRRDLGLPPVERIFHDWIHQADLVVGLFPKWFAPPQPDWPDNVTLTGFPLYDLAPSEGASPELEAFLAAGEPPIVFTAGTATTAENRFFAESVEACRLSGHRGLLLTRYAGQLPSDLPEGVRHFDYVPFSRVLPRAAALVHHGGIGTLSQALAAGIPQLVRPAAYDQHDNAERARRLGVARSLSLKRYRRTAVAEALDELTSSPAVRNACLATAERIRGYDAVAATCDAILASRAAKTVE